MFFPAGASKAYVHKTHFAAWKHGSKGMYYLRTESTKRAENVSMKIAIDKLLFQAKTAIIKEGKKMALEYAYSLIPTEDQVISKMEELSKRNPKEAKKY